MAMESNTITSDGVLVYRGDLVKILDYHKLDPSLQKTSSDPGWVNGMDSYIGTVGEIKQIGVTGNVRVGDYLFAPEWIESAEHDTTEVLSKTLVSIDDISEIL